MKMTCQPNNRNRPIVFMLGKNLAKPMPNKIATVSHVTIVVRLNFPVPEEFIAATIR